MDIEYLLWLQGLRESLPSSVETFASTFSNVAISEALVFVIALIYWCFNKDLGQRIVFSFSISALANNFIKLLACVYRPWIRSPAIHSAKSALAKATGYSFPSGHTQTAGSIFGMAGHYAFKRGKRLLSVLLWLFVVLIGFSRNFLGVHTPQDVLVGLIEAILTIAFVEWFMKWVEGGSNRDLITLVVAGVTLVVATIIVLVKPYPIDYDANGQLLVDPVLMRIDYFKTAGMFAGFFLGWFLERRTLSFEIPAKRSAGQLALRAGVGFVVLFALYFAAKPLQILGAPESVYQVVKNFLVLLSCAYVSPLAFTKVEQLRSQKEPMPRQ